MKELEKWQKDIIKNTKTNKSIYSKIFNYINNHDKDINDWAGEDVDDFLLSFNSISSNSINKYYVMFNKVIEKYYDKSLLDKLKRTKSIEEYIDLERLMNHTIMDHHFEMIRRQIYDKYKGKEYNTRDRLIFELAWECLTNQEIKLLKESDIEFIENDTKIKLHLKNRTQIISDPMTVEDVKKTMKETHYIKRSKKGRVTFIPYKLSKYLIKPSLTRESDVNYICNPSLALQKALFKYHVKLENVTRGHKHLNIYEINIDASRLSINDIRRSKIFYFLGHNVQPLGLSKLLSKREESDLFWMKHIAKLLYDNS